jgi:hypothetical protein
MWNLAVPWWELVLRAAVPVIENNGGISVVPRSPNRTYTGSD